jgi:hypothetical protein
LRYFFLIAWSKQQRKMGCFTTFALELCGGTEEELQELLSSGLVTESEGTYAIPHFAEWQEDSPKQGTGNYNRSVPTTIMQSVQFPEGDFDQEQAFNASYKVWPKRHGDDKKRALIAYKEKIQDKATAQEFHRAVENFVRSWMGWDAERQKMVHFFGNWIKGDHWISYAYQGDIPTTDNNPEVSPTFKNPLD